MCNSTMKRRIDDARGFSLLQMLITFAIIAIVSALAIMPIAGAQQALRLSDSGRELIRYLEKARLDSIRRHAEPAGATMATVTITSNNTYSIMMDFDGNGTVDAPREVTLPQGVTFTGSLPIVMRFNWRGRTVDASGNLTAPASFGLQDTSGRSNTISVTGSGDAGVSSGYEVNQSSVSVSNPTVTTVNTSANVRTGTVISQSTY